MYNRTTDVVELRVASKRCRALAASSEDGFGSLSYAQLADEIDRMIAVREAAIEQERGARLDRTSRSADKL
jgi:hypothetical protein